MSYTKLDPTPFAANLAAGEVVVQLDTGDDVAVRATISVQDQTGLPAMQAWARAVNPDGTTRTGPDGSPIQCSMSHRMTAEELAAVSGAAGALKLAIAAVLGEPTTPLWTDPIFTTVLQDWSIRTNLSTATHWGSVTDLASVI